MSSGGVCHACVACLSDPGGHNVKNSGRFRQDAKSFSNRCTPKDSSGKPCDWVVLFTPSDQGIYSEFVCGFGDLGN